MSDQFDVVGVAAALVSTEQRETKVGDILAEADKLINGDRQQDYGPPDENFQRITDFWNIRFAKKFAPGQKFTPSDVATAMVLLKIARDMQGYKRDSAVDGAAYMDLYAYLNEKGL